MKRISKIRLKLGVLLLMSVMVLFHGCQKEFTEIEEPPTKDVIKSNTNLGDLILSVALKDGSSDNIIDDCSCASLKYPISIDIINETIILNSEEDIEYLKSNYSQSLNDIEIYYPITVILDNYTELVIYNEDELEDLQEDCSDNNEDSDIECIDFIYPFEVALFNIETQVATVVTVNKDQELYYIFNDLDDVLASITYPISLRLSDGSNIEIHNNEELEERIDESEDDCDEDDDQDLSDEALTELISHLMSNVWEVTLFTDTTDETSAFGTHSISFVSESTLLANSGEDTVSGEWELDLDNNEKVLEIGFDTDDSPLVWLNDEWKVISLNETSIYMEATSESEGYVKKLTISVVGSSD
ncbi:hypothetical protein ACXR6G_07400 [Ancylomarina sp. YFZ004]